MTADDRETIGGPHEGDSNTPKERDESFEVDSTLLHDDQLPDLTESGDADLLPRETAAPEIKQIGRYRIKRLLGRGGFGAVYLARDEQLGRLVAIKIAHPDLVANRSDASIYLEEARNVARLDHPHIVPVHDVGATAEVPFYFVSKYINGSNLATMLRQSPVDFYTAAKITAVIAEALHHAHKHGLVHRDVKPGNILIDKSGTPYLVDFGLALSEESVESEPRYVGTPSYTSPEQARGEGHRVDGRSDVFSLGVVLYEMLTRRRPFRGAKRAQVLEQVASYEPRPPRQYNETIPKPLERICQKAMAKLASERYASAFDMAEDLDFFLASSEPTKIAPNSDSYAPSASLNPTAPHSGPDKPTDRGASHVTDASNSQSLADDSTSATAPRVETTSSRGIAIVPKGIRSFDAHDSDFFLELLPGARDRDGLPESIRFWKTRLEETRRESTFPIGLIYGPSGCGKSSLVQAGLLPRLSSHVKSIFIESTSDETESRLLTALHNRCPTLPRERSLVDLFKMIRNGYGPPLGQKIVIVLDQFEQWLHAHTKEQNGALVQALRQCDGGRIQVLVMVRDDFWMAATSFMRELEARISEGQNAAAVDLFPIRHAIKVLDAYGRAFGSLPKPPTQLSVPQETFLRQAIEQLARDGKVICVRLALFAEIMKTRPWTIESLRQVGGAQGVGLQFLEETFDSETAPLAHRYHAKAARLALRELLPPPGESIRGHNRTTSELNRASGYKPGSQDFSELMTILDTEVRLITPCDNDDRIENETQGQAASPAHGSEQPTDGSHQRADGRYQLTHDYLVQSLRSWLTQKQRETKQGRAELLLSERATLWESKPENRHLPTLTEDLRIRWLTDKKRWNSKEQAVMNRSKRVHSTRVATSLACLLLVGLVAIGFQHRFADQQRTSRANEMVRGLAKVEIEELPKSLQRLKPLRDWAEPKLIEEYTESVDGSKEKLRLTMALPADHPDRESYLIEQIPKLSLDEFQVVCDSLAPKAESIEKLWSVAQDESRETAERFQAGCALAKFSPDDARWAELAPLITVHLTADDATVPSFQLPTRIDHLFPVRIAMVPDLLERLGDSETSDFIRERSAITAARFLVDEPEQLVVAVTRSRKRMEFTPLVAGLSQHLDVISQTLRDFVTHRIQDTGPSDRYEPRHHTTAIAAVTLAGFGQIDSYIDLLRPPPWHTFTNPSTAALAKHYASEIPVAIQPVLDRLSDPSTDANVKRHLAETLGRRGLRGLSIPEQNQVIRHLTQLSEEDWDAGVHQASLWALSQLSIQTSQSPIELQEFDDSRGERIRGWQSRIEATESIRKAALADRAKRRADWKDDVIERSESVSDSLNDGLEFRLSIDGPEKISLLTSEDSREAIEQQISVAKKATGILDYCIEFDDSDPIELGDVMGVERDEPFSYGCWLYSRSSPQWGAAFSRMQASDGRRGFDLWLDGTRIAAHLVHREPDDYIKVITQDSFEINGWYHFFVTYDGTSRASGLKIYIDGELAPTHTLADRLSGTMKTTAPALLGSRFGEFPASGWIDDIRFYREELPGAEVQMIYESVMGEVLKIPEGQRSPEQQASVARAFRDEVTGQLDEELERLRTNRNKEAWAGRRRWFVNSQGQAFTVAPGSSAETTEAALDYDFAISNHEVTIEQYKQFNSSYRYDPEAANSPQCPVHGLNWFEVAEYCNWLSKHENIPEDQWCFEPNEDGEYDQGMKLKPNFQELSGYRLPSAAEWRLACRGGSETRFFFGSPSELLVEYAWYDGNALGFTQPVGMLAPNAYGLFDTHGNVWEWTLDMNDRIPTVGITDEMEATLLGGAMNSGINAITITGYAKRKPNLSSYYYGFRLVQGVPR